MTPPWRFGFPVWAGNLDIWLCQGGWIPVPISDFDASKILGTSMFGLVWGGPRTMSGRALTLVVTRNP